MKTPLLWGTYGKDGQQPLKWKLLHELETDHLENIVRHMEEHSEHYDLLGTVKYMHAIKNLLVERGGEIPEDVQKILERYTAKEEITS